MKYRVHYRYDTDQWMAGRFDGVNVETFVVNDSDPDLRSTLLMLDRQRRHDAEIDAVTYEYLKTRSQPVPSTRDEGYTVDGEAVIA